MNEAMGNPSLSFKDYFPPILPVPEVGILNWQTLAGNAYGIEHQIKLPSSGEQGLSCLPLFPTPVSNVHWHLKQL